MKKIFTVLFITLLALSILMPFLSTYAKSCTQANCPGGERRSDCCPKREDGIVPCGTTCCGCMLCDLFVLIDRIIDFVLFRLAPVAAVLIIIIGGAMFLVSSGNPGTISKAKSIITSVIIGLVIMYSAYMVIGFVLKTIGLSDWSEEIYSSWLSNGVFNIKCGENYSLPD